MTTPVLIVQYFGDGLDIAYEMITQYDKTFKRDEGNVWPLGLAPIGVRILRTS